MQPFTISVVPLREADISLDEIIDEFALKASTYFGEGLQQMIDPLREAVQNKAIDGWVAFGSGRALGMVTTLQREGMGRINFIHILSSYQERGVSSALITRAVSEMRKAHIHRINSEAAIFTDERLIRETFRELGFRAIQRMVMALHLESMPAPSIPPGVTLLPWDDTRSEEVIDVMFDANSGGIDILVYPEMGSREGVGRMVRGILNGRSGPFDRETSLIALSEGVVSGVILMMQLPPHEAFIAELAVAKRCQGRGIGRVLLAKSLSLARERGVETVKLGVTEENEAALHLYQGLGFQTEERVTAHVWED